MPTLYVVSRCLEFEPYLDWVQDAWSVIESDHPEHNDWNLGPILRGDARNSFDWREKYAVIAQSLGPVLFVGGLDAKAIQALEIKLDSRVFTRRCPAPTDSADIYESMLEALARHKSGEPEVPRKFVAALLLVRKLERRRYWGGNAKNFLTVNDLAKGRGLDEAYGDVAHGIADYLASEHRRVRLLSSKLGDRYAKYACNNERRAAVYTFLRERWVDDEDVMRWLKSDPCRVSARELDILNPDDYKDSR